MLGAEISSQIVDYFEKGRYEGLQVCYISLSYFGLPRQSIRNNSDIIKLFKQSLRNVESMYEDIGGYDMAYSNLRKCVVMLGVKHLTIIVLI